MNAEIPKAEAKVYTLKVKLTGRRATDHEWIRVIEMLDDYTLYDVHCVIQEVINFDDDHMYEFYIGTRWDKRVTEIEGGPPPRTPVHMTTLPYRQYFLWKRDRNSITGSISGMAGCSRSHAPARRAFSTRGQGIRA